MSISPFNDKPVNGIQTATVQPQRANINNIGHKGVDNLQKQINQAASRHFNRLGEAQNVNPFARSGY